MNNSFDYFLLDTFTDNSFEGNPTPVCTVDLSISSEEMKSWAKEFSAPVMVFIRALEGKNVSPRKIKKSTQKTI